MRIWFTTGAADGQAVVGTARDHTAVPHASPALDLTNPARAEVAGTAQDHTTVPLDVPDPAPLVGNASRGPLVTVTSAGPPPRIRPDSVAGVKALVRQEPNAWRGRSLSTGHTG